MAKESNKKNCSLCRSKSSAFRETLYGALICYKCHVLLIDFEVRSVEDIDESIQNEENRWGKYLEDFRKNVPCRELSSWTRERIKSTAFKIGILTFFTTWFITFIVIIKLPKLIYTTLYTETSLFLALLIWGSIYPVIPFLLSIIVGEFYFKLMVKQKHTLIEKDLERDKKKIEQEKNEKIEQAERKAKWHSSRCYGYSRYKKIIDKATKEKILLYEYFRREYPPDWEYRANVVRNRDGNCCKKCGEKSVLHVHHIKSVRDGGLHFLDNLISLCTNCHLKEHPYLLESGFHEIRNPLILLIYLAYYF